MKIKHQRLYSAFFRETKTFYRIEDLKKLLKSPDSKEITQNHANYIYQKLLNENVIKSCTKKQFDLNELNEEEVAQKEEDDPSIINSGEKGFFFRFVGVVYIDDCILKIYPKYINLNDGKITPYDFEDVEETKRKTVEEHFSKTLRVIRKISKDSQNVSLTPQNKDKYNHIAMQIFLLEDYYRNGIYDNKETVIETNGEGEIDWDKTINETTAIIKNNKPYYVELQTINTRNNDFDYFKLLHESILCECSRTLRDTGLLTYLGMVPCELTGMELSSFGDISYIKYRLQQEIRTQFVTRKRNQLISLLTYITEATSHKHSNTLKLFGSYHFEHVWEVVCKSVFNDLYKNDYRIDNSGLKESPSIKQLLKAGLLKTNTLPESTDCSLNFKDLIERVDWNMTVNKSVISCTPDGSLTPDLICIDEKENFYILDAKYYILKINPDKRTIENQPGIQDVLKQFAYERAYRDFLKDFRFYRTVNAFIMPSLYSEWENESDGITYLKGNVTFSLMQTSSYELLGPIQVLEANPEFLYENFLQSKLCLHELTSYLASNGILHSINRYISSDGTDIGFTMTGFLRSWYVKQIKENSDFLFYFYVKKDYRELQIHPELLQCTNFIGYTEENTEGKVIKGQVIPEIKKVSGTELRKLLTDMGYDKKSSDREEYYCIKIEKAKIQTFSSEAFAQLKKEMKEAPGNYLLEKYAPKVI